MTILWTSAEIAAATGGTASTGFACTGVTFDSREVRPGDLFVALKGETTDGHRYLDAAFAAGAAGAIVSEPVPFPNVLCADGYAALNALGVAARARTAGRIAGVTGSVGKTGTKEALYAALERFRPGLAHRSVKSYNNHTGVPLSLARMPREARFGVFEMGMNHAGEIAALTRIVRPHVAVVTAIAPAHIEQLGSLEAIANAKGEIFAGLESGGTAIIPSDSAYCARLADHARAAGARIVTFGLNEGADVRGSDIVAASGGGSHVTAIMGDGRQVNFVVAQDGTHWVSNALAVIAAVDALGADIVQAGLALAELPGLAGRGARTQFAVGDGQALLIDESYNANPASMAATLAALACTPARRRIAVLGAMKELGEHGPGLHAGLAGPVADAGVDHAVLVGEEMKSLADALEGRTDFAHVADAAAALHHLKLIVAPGDAVLVKGSNALGLSRLVAALAEGVN